MSIANENRRLREIVQQLLDRIDENQKTLSHFQAFELQLLNAAGIHELLHLLLDESCRHFRLASASLLLLDRDENLQELFDSIQVGNFHNRLQLRQNPDFYQKIYPADPRIILQEVDVLTATRLFPGAPKVGSAAFLPLILQQQVIGSLHFASSEERRFTPNKATDLLDHVAAIAAVCVQHNLEREAQQLLVDIDPKLSIGSVEYFARAFDRELRNTLNRFGHIACVVVALQDPECEMEASLPALSKALREAVRKVDLCARWQDGRWVVLLPDSDSRQAQATTVRIAKALLALEDPALAKVCVGTNAWKVRKTKQQITDDKLEEQGQSLLLEALASAKPLAEWAL